MDCPLICLKKGGENILEIAVAPYLDHQDMGKNRGLQLHA